MVVPVILALAAAGCAAKPPRHLMGAYQFPDGRLVSVRADENNTLRYREFQTGESRRLHRHRRLRYVAGGAFSSRAPVQLVVDFTVGENERATGLSWRPKDGETVRAERINAEEWVEFESGDITLFGRLDMPDGRGPDPFPAIVLVHDSEVTAATDFFYANDFFAANGIAALTFDKRGTGRSGGAHSSDFEELAGDVLAAVAYLRSRPDIDGSRIGLSGYGQGGRVGPLAASKTDDVRYVIVNFGMIESPAEQTRLRMLNLLNERGVKDEALEQIDELTVAATEVIASGFKEWNKFDEVKAKYKEAEWKKALKGTAFDDLYRYPHFLAKLVSSYKYPKELDWHYDSTMVLRDLDTPVAWLLAEEDGIAPNKLTIPKLREMIAAGRPFELVVFPGADHSMLLFREDEKLGRVYTGYAPHYFTTEVDRARRFSGLDD